MNSRRTAPRTKHTNADIEKFMRYCEEKKGWEFVLNKKNYFRARCSCPEKEQRWVHQTPNQGYLRDLQKWFERTACWNKEGDDT